jgi:tetratricopeptide (TPR) repeat protein
MTDLALAPEHAGVLALLANQVFVAEDWDRARDLYARIDRAPDSSAVIARETLVLRRALLARRAGDVDEAATCYREVAGSNPRHVEARMALAEIALVRGEPGVAAECLEEVLRLLPLDALEPLLDVRQRLAEIHVQLGDWTTARYYTELILAQDPGRLSALERLVDAGLHLDLPQLAVDACDRIARLQREPAQRARALYRQGEILREALGDEERAFDIYLRSSDWDPGFAPTALRLVEGYWRRGHFADAAGIGDDLRRAGPLPPMETSVRLHLALATALAHGDAGAAFTVADLSTTAWDAESGAGDLGLPRRRRPRALGAGQVRQQQPRCADRDRGRPRRPPLAGACGRWLHE